MFCLLFKLDKIVFSKKGSISSLLSFVSFTYTETIKYFLALSINNFQLPIKLDFVFLSEKICLSGISVLMDGKWSANCSDNAIANSKNKNWEFLWPLDVKVATVLDIQKTFFPNGFEDLDHFEAAQFIWQQSPTV